MEGGGVPILHIKFKKCPCRCRLFMPLLHVDFKKCLCPLSLSFLTSCRISLGSTSPVEFKKCPCRPVDFRGLSPLWWGFREVNL